MAMVVLVCLPCRRLVTAGGTQAQSQSPQSLAQAGFLCLLHFLKVPVPVPGPLYAVCCC